MPLSPSVFIQCFCFLGLVIHHTNSGWQRSLSTVRKINKYKVLLMKLKSLFAINTPTSHSEMFLALIESFLFKYVSKSKTK